MKRSALNFAIDAISALVMVGMVATGLLMRFVLPPGSGNRTLVWGLGRHDWGDVHFWMAAAVAGVIVLHVALHWQWVCITVMRVLHFHSGRQTVPGAFARNLAGGTFVLLISAVIGGFVWGARMSVTEVAGGRYGWQAGQPDRAPEPFVAGYMTLSQAAEAYGIDVKTAQARLALPGDLHGDETMGRLIRRNGISMQEARQRLATGQSGSAQD